MVGVSGITRGPVAGDQHIGGEFFPVCGDEST